MILTLIFGVITLAAIVLVIIGFRTSEDEFFGWAAVGGIVGGIPFLLSILIICCVQNPIEQEAIKVKYEQSITQLTSTRDYINTITDDSKSVAVQQYNADVKDFKQEIIVEQLKLKNPWINWYHSYAYLKLDADVVSYIQ